MNQRFLCAAGKAAASAASTRISLRRDLFAVSTGARAARESDAKFFQPPLGAGGRGPSGATITCAPPSTCGTIPSKFNLNSVELEQIGGTGFPNRLTSDDDNPVSGPKQTPT